MTELIFRVSCIVLAPLLPSQTNATACSALGGEKKNPTDNSGDRTSNCMAAGSSWQSQILASFFSCGWDSFPVSKSQFKKPDRI